MLYVRHLPLFLVASPVYWLLYALPENIQLLMHPSRQSLPGEVEGVISVAGLLWVFLVNLPLWIGTAILALRIAAGQPAGVRHLFSAFRIYSESLATTLLMTFIFSGGLLLLIVPGIYGMLKYSQAPYLLAYRTDLAPWGTLKRSAVMMEGSKSKLLAIYILLGPLLMAGTAWYWLVVGSRSGWDSPNIAPAYIGSAAISIVVLPFSWLVAAVFHRDICPSQQAT